MRADDKGSQLSEPMSSKLAAKISFNLTYKGVQFISNLPTQISKAKVHLKRLSVAKIYGATTPVPEQDSI